MLMSQSREGRDLDAHGRVMNRGVNSMPIAFGWRWTISNVSARSGLPEVVVNANLSSPTPGQLKIFELLALGVSGPPVQPPFFKIAIAFRWLNFHRATCRLVLPLERLEDEALQDGHLLHRVHQARSSRTAPREAAPG